MMRATFFRILMACSTFVFAACAVQRPANSIAASPEFAAKPLSVDTLLAWPVYGRGSVEGYRNQAVILREQVGSAGLMLVSPKPYGQRVVLRYRVMTLQAGSVLVAILSTSGPEEAGTLSLPEGYDGGIGPWLGPNPNYFFAFHNAPHMRNPFVIRVGDGDTNLLEEADRAYMTVGRWHDVEVGRRDGRLWLSIDGQRVIDTTDTPPLGSGRIALRIRGTGPELASAMIRDVRISEE
ncbi:MAG: hypothetical protein AAF288_06015 [Planctomycetota bacterium]